MPNEPGRLCLPPPKSNFPPRGLPARASTSSPNRPAPTSGCCITISAPRKTCISPCWSGPTAPCARRNASSISPISRRLKPSGRLVEFKFDYCEQHQQIIALLAGENMLGAAYLKRSKRLRDMNLSLVDVIRTRARCRRGQGRDQARDRSGASVHLDVGPELLLLLQFGDAVGGVRAATGQSRPSGQFGGRMPSMSSWPM